MGVVAAVGLSGCKWDVTSFFDLRVVNNTDATVKIRPCWDAYCVNTSGMPVTLLRPGASEHEDAWWPTDTGENIAVAVLSQRGKRVGCLLTSFAQGQPRGLVRVSHLTRCPLPPAGGPPAGP